MADFDTEPSGGISLDDAHRLISISKTKVGVKVARKIAWRSLARLPLRRSGASAVVLFIASLAVPHESILSLLLLIGAAVFGSMVLERHRRRKNRG